MNVVGIDNFIMCRQRKDIDEINIGMEYGIVMSLPPHTMRNQQSLVTFTDVHIFRGYEINVVYLVFRSLNDPQRLMNEMLSKETKTYPNLDQLLPPLNVLVSSSEPASGKQ